MKQKLNDNLLILWIYFDLFNDLAQIMFPSLIFNKIGYIILIIFMIISIINNKFRINKNLAIFFGSYLFIASINILVVNYKRYVIVESLSSFLLFMVPLYIISQKDYKFDNLFRKWKKVAIYSLPVVLIMLILYKNDYLSYDKFDSILIPNFLILSYFFSKKQNRKLIILLLFYIGILAIFGSRMAAFTCLSSLIINELIFNSKKPSLKRTLEIAIPLTIIVIILLANYHVIVQSILDIFTKYNIKSRTISLLARENSLSNLYLSGRGEVYKSAFSFIKKMKGLPGGFGIILYLTNGDYYHAHNLFLQMGCVFGPIISIIFIFLIINRVKNIKEYLKKDVYSFDIMLLIFYLIYSIGNSNFLTSFISILSLTILFLSNENSNKNIPKENDKESSIVELIKKNKKNRLEKEKK